MAAFETPWTTYMAPSPAKGSGNGNLSTGGDDTSTYASFSPSQSYASPATKQRSTILVHKKSPLLIATPPSVTRALAFSHPFILPLNKVVGLLSWSSGDPWESFLVVAAFWAVTLYGDVILQWAGPLVLVVFLIIGMYSRRYSPLSSTGWTGEKVSGQKDQTEGSMKHQKSLDEIVDILTIFTSRCNTLLEPFLALTDFLSTQQTATSATTRPALTTLFIRILFVSPFWIFMTIPPLVHTVPPDPQGKKAPPPLPPRHKSQDSAANAMCKQSLQSKGVRFTFVVFENQRRWLGLGWTRSLLAYERAPWTDEQLNPSNSKDNFQLPHIDGASAKWQWVEGSEWKVERGGKSKTGDEADGWIFYDNKWNNGHRGQDGWGRYTRRRKWYRDAELVEIPETEMASSVATLVPDTPSKIPAVESSKANQVPKETDDSSSSQKRRRGFLRRDSRSSTQSGAYSASSTLGIDDSDHLMPMDHDRNNADWGVGDDIKMGLG
ncbi:MAG: hypothetical protein Q9206_002814 [Seirophora lacunosa]